MKISWLVSAICFFAFSCSRGPCLLVFGDSISAGSYTEFSYPQRLANEFEIQLDNLSVTSTTLEDAAQIGAIRSSKIQAGDKILFSPGINDALVHGWDPIYLLKYESLLREAFGKFEMSGGEAYVGGPTHVLDKDLDTRGEMYSNMLLKTVASYRHVHLVKSRELFIPTVDSMHDSVHPNNKGHFQLYKIFSAAMKE